MSIVNILRWIHVISGVAWLGEVVTINVVLVPVLIKIKKDHRGLFIRQVFPRVFRLASILSLTAVLSGGAMSYLITGWRDIPGLLQTRWGVGIIIGGVLGLSLTLFHFFVESRLEPIAVAVGDDSGTDTDFDTKLLIRVLHVVPRIGLFVLVLVILSMMYAARGL